MIAASIGGGATLSTPAAAGPLREGLGAALAGSLNGALNGSLDGRQVDFASLLNIDERRPGVDTRSDQAKARSAAQAFVAQALVKPVLSMLRESSQAAAPFAPTQAERAFGTLADGRIAEDIVRASRFPLVERLTRDLLRGAGEGGALEVEA